MPTVFTHALTGGALAVLAPDAVRNRRLMIGLAAVAMLPDADVVGWWLGVPYGAPLGHRGFLHSIPFALLVGFAAPLVLHRDASLRTRIVLSVGYVLATASHGLLDALTDGGRGVGLWIPFSNERFFAPFRPILTSSLDPSHAFGARGLRVLANVACYIAIPTVAGILLVVLLRMLGRARTR